MINLGTNPDHPSHGCAFCGERLAPGAPDMITLFLGDPDGSCAVLWSHRGCLTARVQPHTAKQLGGVAAGDFLPEHRKRRRSS